MSSVVQLIERQNKFNLLNPPAGFYKMWLNYMLTSVQPDSNKYMYVSKHACACVTLSDKTSDGFCYYRAKTGQIGGYSYA